MIPGANLLNQAMSVIASQTVTWHRFKEREPNEALVYVTTYHPAQIIRGSWQPIPRRLYQSEGLDFQNIYVNFYVSKQILDVQRDISGDQVAYCGKRYQAISATDWVSVDGWTAILLCQIGDKDAR